MPIGLFSLDKSIYNQVRAIRFLWKEFCMTKPRKQAKIRLYTAYDLFLDTTIRLDEKQTHYLKNVMRLGEGAAISLFNGRDGEWQGELHIHKEAIISINQQILTQTTQPTLKLAFAVVKKEAAENIIRQATELGVSEITPVRTKHSVNQPLPYPRLRSIAVEAAEQCERLSIPEIYDEQSFSQFCGNISHSKPLIYGDETGRGNELGKVLNSLDTSVHPTLLTGPEGGFAISELEWLRSNPFSISVSMGPRILKADTAAICMLSTYMSILGDWANKPNFRSAES
jgi:16S rRNA (uracil1498-N3)-methyltransferase